MAASRASGRLWPRCSRLLRGGTSFLQMLVFPLGCCCRRRWCAPERLAEGYTIILPGIESKSFLNYSIALGLLDGGVRSAVEIFDWTTGCILLCPYHLRGLKRNRRMAQVLADKIVAYRRQHPGRPVNLIGHSGGGGVALLTLEALPQDCRIASAILLNAAVSPRYELGPALEKTECGIVNFCSVLDVLFLCASTSLFGTIEGRHCIAAGCRGFVSSAATETTDTGRPGLRQQRFEPAMIGQFNFGGHFGFTNRVFVAERIAPLIREHETAPPASPQR